jgi:hypothetical protein
LAALLVSELDQLSVDLYGRTVRTGGDPEDVHVAAADPYDEQAAQAPGCHHAVHMEEVVASMVAA